MSRILKTMGLATLVIPTASLALAQPEWQEVSVADPRSLAAAVLVIQARARIPISYEDPPYLYPGDVDRRYDGTPIPRGGLLRFRYPADAKVDAALQTAVDASAREGYPGVFGVVGTPGWYHVVPTAARKASGEMGNHRSILDTIVSLSVRKAAAATLVEKLCEQLSLASGMLVTVGMYPPHHFSREYASYDPAPRTGREHLMQLIRDSGQALSWRLLYGPETHRYILNIHYVGFTLPQRG